MSDFQLYTEDLIHCLEQHIASQREEMVRVAQRHVAYIQYDDLLQPQDFPAIDQDPDFRYEEGVLYGLERALLLIRRSRQECEERKISSLGKQDK